MWASFKDKGVGRGNKQLVAGAKNQALRVRRQPQLFERGGEGLQLSKQRLSACLQCKELEKAETPSSQPALSSDCRHLS